MTTTFTSRNIYADDEKKDGTNEDWDEETLNDVISKKHGQEKSNQTDIVSEYLIFSVHLLLNAKRWAFLVFIEDLR